MAGGHRNPGSGSGRSGEHRGPGWAGGRGGGHSGARHHGRQQIGTPVSPNTNVDRESARYGESSFAYEPHNAQTQSFVHQSMSASAARSAEATTSAGAATAGATGPAQRVRPIAIVEPAEACLGCGTCATACRRGAITINQQVTPAAQIDVAACTGCGRCVAACAEHIIVLRAQ